MIFDQWIQYLCFPILDIIQTKYLCPSTNDPKDPLLLVETIKFKLKINILLSKILSRNPNLDIFHVPN